MMSIHVKKFQQALRHSHDIFVPHGKHTHAGKNDQDAFRELNGGDRAHAFDVFGIVDDRMRDSRMWDFGMHAELLILRL
jgi:hypothetical protein